MKNCTILKLAFYFWLTTYLIALYSCGGECSMKTALASTVQELASVNEQLEACQSADSIQLMHLVYLTTKPDLQTAEVQELESSFQELSLIPEVRKFKVGKPASTGDPRLKSEYNYVLQMGFDSEEALQRYKTNETHVNLREQTKKYMAGPPVVFDYWVQ